MQHGRVIRQPVQLTQTRTIPPGQHATIDIHTHDEGNYTKGKIFEANVHLNVRDTKPDNLPIIPLHVFNQFDEPTILNAT